MNDKYPKDEEGTAWFRFGLSLSGLRDFHTNSFFNKCNLKHLIYCWGSDLVYEYLVAKDNILSVFISIELMGNQYTNDSHHY